MVAQNIYVSDCGYKVKIPPARLPQQLVKKPQIPTKRLVKLVVANRQHRENSGVNPHYY